MNQSSDLRLLANPRQVFKTGDSILVLGAVRNVERTLNDNLEGLSRAIPQADLSWFLFESNSSDSTLEKLAGAKMRIANFSFSSVISAQKLPRLSEIRKARSQLLEYARTVSPSPDYVLVVDFDQLYQWENVTFMTSLEKFDVLFCHQNPYYDIFAFSPYSETWAEGVPLNYASIGRLGRLWRALMIVPGLQLYLGRLTQPLRVKSAFGGMALYRTPVFLEGSYFRPEYPEQEFSDNCEHLDFHDSIVRNFPDLFIDPNFRVPIKNEHSHLANGVLRAGRIVKRLQVR